MTQTVLLVAVDQGVNLTVLKELQKAGKIKLQQVRDIEQKFKQVLENGQPFQLDVSLLDGPDMLADNNVYDVENLFGKNQQNDFLHVYSAHQIHADYFVTNDKTDFIANGKREKLEKLMPGLKIRMLDEFLEEIGAKK
jgi:hypothetical protein